MRKPLLLFAVLGLAGSLWAADPFIGTWKLNVAKSKASDPSRMPKSEIMKSEVLFDEIDGHLHFREHVQDFEHFDKRSSKPGQFRHDQSVALPRKMNLKP